MKYLKIDTNFSFKKLSSKVDDILNKYKGDVSPAYAKGAKDRIDSRIPPKLSPFTVRNRRPGTGDLPLKETGKLYKSIKGTKLGLEMVDYGAEHQKGYPSSMPNARPVPARPFFGSEFVSEKEENEAKKKLEKNLKKGLMK